MTRRRTLLAAISAGTVGTAGCLGILGGGGTEETGEQQTIADDGTTAPTATATAAPTTQVSTQETIEPATEEGTDEGTDAGTQVPSVDLSVIVDEITECGRTCRTLAYTVQNRGGAGAENVTVEVAVRTPDADGDVVYEGTQELGAIDSERQRQATTNLTLGEDGAAAVQNNDGSVAVEITAVADDGTSETAVETTSFGVRTATAAPTATTTPGPFDVSVDEITECGTACRTLDYTIQNRGDQDLTGIQARIRVYTPDTDGERVYDDDQEIGDLAAGTQIEATKDIDVGLVDGQTIRDNDGDIDIRVNLSTNEGVTQEFVFDEQLSD